MSTNEREAEAPPREVVVGKTRLRDSQFGVQAFTRTHPTGGYWTTATATQIATFREVARLQDALAAGASDAQALADEIAGALGTRYNSEGERAAVVEIISRALAAALRRAEEAERERDTVGDALRNCMGLLDTPLGRRRNEGDPFYGDVISEGRAALALLPEPSPKGVVPTALAVGRVEPDELGPQCSHAPLAFYARRVPRMRQRRCLRPGALPMTTPAVRLSPDEVAALPDKELSLRVVRDVLGGWLGNAADLEWRFAAWSEGGPIWWRPGRPRDEAQRFSPSNPVAVDHVIEHMRERGCEWQMETVGRDMWSARILPPGFSTASRAVAAQLGRAVFESAVLSAQEMNG